MLAKKRNCTEAEECNTGIAAFETNNGFESLRVGCMLMLVSIVLLLDMYIGFDGFCLVLQ